MLIDLFINAGWFTVPLKGELRRTESGKKTLPVFESEWKSKYAQEFNTKRVGLAGVLTGKLSGIIAIDCDNQATYDIFKAMDPDYTFHFISQGKPEGGGTIIYRYTNDIGGFKHNTDGAIALDFYADEGFVYLPTEDNHSKVSWEGTEALPEVHEPPASILALLKSLKAKSELSGQGVVKTTEVKRNISNRLAPMLEQLIKGKKYDPVAFKVLTPYSFRDLPSYITKGHLHPNDVPIGRGSEYLSKLSAILGADISVNVELYTNVMMLVNSMWDDPMEKSKLMATIMNPMVESRATVDGQPIWQYDEHWELMGFIATSLNGDYLESFYDDVKGLYYLVNYSVPYVKTFNEKRGTINMLKSLVGRAITENQYDSTKQLIRTILNPSMEFGHVSGSDSFNLFRQTPELNVLNNPTSYAKQYVRPEATIQYFQSLIPDDEMRAYVLSYIKTKLTTFKYSPVILYMIGKPGSGKDTMVSILRRIIGDQYVAKPDTKVFLEHYNGWMIDKYVVQLDEYGNKLTRNSDKQEVLGKLKAYTGSSELQIRAMRQDGFNYHHSLTFIVTANSNPLAIENEDRRVAYIKTPNKLVNQPWVQEMGGVSHVVERLIPAETMDFCYYLATEVNALSSDSYVTAPETEDKEKLILDSMPAAEQIVYFIQNSRFEELAELAIDFDVPDFRENWDKNKLMDDRLAALYDAMTEGHGASRTVIKMLKNIGMNRSHTTRNGANVWYYFINDLHHFAVKPEEDFEPQFETHATIKGL